MLFKKLKSRVSLDEMNATDVDIIEALIIMSAISLMMSRVIVDECGHWKQESTRTKPPQTLTRRRRGSLGVAVR